MFFICSVVSISLIHSEVYFRILARGNLCYTVALHAFWQVATFATLYSAACILASGNLCCTVALHAFFWVVDCVWLITARRRFVTYAVGSIYTVKQLLVHEDEMSWYQSVPVWQDAPTEVLLSINKGVSSSCECFKFLTEYNIDKYCRPIMAEVLGIK